MPTDHPIQLVANRRSVVKELAGASLLAAMPWVNAPGIGQEKQEPIRLGSGAAILNVPENKAILARIAAEKELTPEQLLAIATNYRDNSALAPLAYRLAAAAMAKLGSSNSVNKAMASIAKTEIEWSFWGDVWNKVKNFFTGGTADKDPSRCKYKCVGLIVISALLEKCGDRDDWHIIGACTGFKW